MAEETAPRLDPKAGHPSVGHGMEGRPVRVFVSSPADAQVERVRIERVVERLNGQFGGTVRLETVRWEREFYKAHATFQAQIPEAADCDIVLAVLRHRLGTPLPDDFARLPSGEPYPSGTAYEILTAMEAARGRGLPDLYVFRYPEPPMVRLDDIETSGQVTEQWRLLKAFFERWFRTPSGQFKASYHEFHTSDEFEAQVESLLRKWVEDRVLRGRAVVWPIETMGSPFRGLSAFGARHAPVFFGRSREIARALDALKDAADRATPFLLLIGASGVGKSSLAKAGLLARVTTPGVVGTVDLWRVAVLTPTDAAGGPFASLAARLFDGPDDLAAEDRGRPFALPELREGDYATPQALTALLSHADEAAASPIVRALDKVGAAERRGARHDRPVRANLLLVVDQLDELFAATVAPEQRGAFARLLKILVATGRVWVIATLRADLYERFLAEPDLLALKTRGATWDLGPPGPAELAEIVRGPADAADLAFGADPVAGIRLDEKLLADADRPDMLPLLQFTLDQLFARRERRDGRTLLTHAAYAELGGIGGAVDRQAEAAVASLPEAEQSRLPRLLRQLAQPTREAPGALAMRAVPLAEAAHDAPAARLVDSLVAARILTTAGVGDATTVRLAHERVLVHWARAREITGGSAAFYRIRADVEDQRRRWEESGRKRDLLIARGIPLAEAESILAGYSGELAPETAAFIAASGRAARTRLRLLAAAAALFAVVALVAIWQTVQAESRRAEAVLERERAEREAARAELSLEGAIFAIDSLTRNVAQDLRDVAGVPLSVIRGVLDGARDTIDLLATTNPDDIDLQHSRAVMLSEFALTFIAQGDLDSALASAGESLADMRTLAAARPGNAEWQLNVAIALQRLGSILVDSGDLTRAGPTLAEGIAVARRSVATSPDDRAAREVLFATLDLLASVQLQQGDAASALATIDEELSIGRALIAAQPDDSFTQRNLSVALNKLGDLHLSTGNLAEAEAAYQEGLATSRALVASDPDNALWQRDVITHLENLSEVEAAHEAYDAAGALLDEALAIARGLTARDPGNVIFQRELSTALTMLGDARIGAVDPVGAAPYFQESLTISEAIAAADPNNSERQRDLGIAYDRVASVYFIVGAHDEALALYEHGLAIARELLARAPDSTSLKIDLLVSLYQIALASTGQRRAAAAAEALALLADMNAAGLLTPDQQGWPALFENLPPEAEAEPLPPAPAENPLPQPGPAPPQ